MIGINSYLTIHSPGAQAVLRSYTAASIRGGMGMLRSLGLGVFIVALLGGLIVALVGCGQKGDLYLPQSKNAATQTSSAPAKSQSSSSSTAASAEAKSTQ